MAKETVNRQINIFIQSGEAQKVYDSLIAKEKKLNEELAKTSDPKRIKQLNAELAKLAEPISRASKKLSGELAPSLRDNTALAKKLTSELSRQFDPAKAKQLRELNGLIRQQKAEINGLSGAQNSLRNQSPFGRIAEFAKGSFLGGAMLQVIGSFKQFLSDSISEALDADETTAKFKATLDNLGRSDAFDRIIGKAQAIADKFKYLDNDEVVGVFNKLIDYGKLTEKQMDQLLPVIVDFAAKQRISIGEASDVIVKALEGNGKALKTYGIDLKDAKTEGERLGIVMGTLKEKVDGAAEAFGNSAAGSIASTQQQFKNLKEEIGTQLLPVLTTLMGWVNKLLTGFTYLGGKVKEWSETIKAFATGGITGLAELEVKRMEELKNKLNQNIVNDLLTEMTGKSVAEVGEKINELNTRLVQLIEKQERAKKNASGIYDKKDVKDAADGIALIRMELDALYKLNSGADQTLGFSQKETAELDKNLKKIADDFKRLKEELDAMRRARQGEAISPMEKEVAELITKFEKLKELAHGNREKLKQIDTEYYEQLFQIQLKYGRQEIAEFERQQEEAKKKQQQLLDKLTGGGVRTSTADRLAGIFDLVGQDNAAKRELQMMQSRGRQRLVLIRQQLQDEERAEIDAVQNRAAALGASEETIQNMLALIRAKFREKDRQETMQYYAALANEIGGYLQQAAEVVATFAQIATDRENAELQRDAEMNERKKENLERRLKKGLITQLQHDREVQRIEREQERRERDIKIRQFKRNQRMSIIQATINGYMAVTNALATVQPFWAAIAAAAIAAASTAAQIASIASQKPPEYGNGGKYGDGGKTSGRPHSQGGNPILDGRTGKKIGEIEEDEGIINKRSMRDRRQYTVSGTVSQIGSLLNRLHGGVHWESGAKLVPAWRMAKPAHINMPNVQKYYAFGGVMGSNSINRTVSSDNQQSQAAANKETNDMLITTLMGMQNTIGSMQSTISDLQVNGIKAFTVLREQEFAKERMDAIKDDATLKG